MSSLAASEHARLAALRALEVLYTPPEQIYDDVVKLARQMFEVPIALVSLIDEDQQWFKACAGLATDRTSREVSFCAHAISQDDLSRVFIVPDATVDERFCDNPLVVGAPHIRMYAGAPLQTRDGHAIGTLCVIDTRPRQFSEQECEALKVLANTVITNFELRRTARDLRASEQFSRLVIESALDAVVVVNGDLLVEEWNFAAQSTFGLRPGYAYGRAIDALLLPADADEAERATFAGLFNFDLDRPTGDAPGRIARPKVRRIEIELACNGERFPADMSVSHMAVQTGTRFAIFARDITARKLAEQARAEASTRDVAIFALARLAESRDPETGAHIERVQSYCKALAEHLATTGYDDSLVDPEFVQLMYTTSPLHDIGKVGIPDDVLLKPGRLDPREFAIMKTHTTIGAKTLEAAMKRFPETRFLRMARNIAATHHERFDGSGYPAGLRGSEIPLCGRIVALADVYDALTSRRVYKEAYSHEVARGIIEKESGKHFDPAIIDAFLAIEDTFMAISRRFAERVVDAA